MSSEALDLLQLEIQEHRDTLAPQLEGFEDLSDVNVSDITKGQVVRDIEDARRREELAEIAMSVLKRLSDDGYPELPIIKVPADIYRDLAEQKRTIDAALARYEPLPQEAKGGSVSIE